MLPDWYVLMMVGIFGAIIGSFLNVVIYRIHTGRSINGHSHCLSCAAPLRWFELFPVISYLALRGRCRSCGSYIPARYLVVELLTALTFILVYQFATDWMLLGLYFLLLAVLIVAAVYDLYHMIIPNEIPIVLGVITLSMAGYQLWPHYSLVAILPVLLSGAIGYGFFALLWLVSRGRWLGLGDAKLALPLALPLSVTQVTSFILLSFWIGALVSVLLIGLPLVLHSLGQWLKRMRYRSAYAAVGLAMPVKSFTMKSEIPFAPFLIIAFLLTYFAHVDAFSLVDYVLQIFI